MVSLHRPLHCCLRRMGQSLYARSAIRGSFAIRATILAFPTLSYSGKIDDHQSRSYTASHFCFYSSPPRSNFTLFLGPNQLPSTFKHAFTSCPFLHFKDFGLGVTVEEQSLPFLPLVTLHLNANCGVPNRRHESRKARASRPGL